MSELTPEQCKLIEGNINFVHHMLREYYSSYIREEKATINYDDLFQAGCQGLIRAAQKFEPEKGFKFTTYAGQWILQHIQRYIDNNGRAIRIPVGELVNRRKAYAANGYYMDDDLPSTVSLIASNEEEEIGYGEHLQDESIDVFTSACIDTQYSQRLREILQNILSQEDYDLVAYRYSFNAPGEKVVPFREMFTNNKEKKALRKQWDNIKVTLMQSQELHELLDDRIAYDAPSEW